MTKVQSVQLSLASNAFNPIRPGGGEGGGGERKVPALILTFENFLAI